MKRTLRVALAMIALVLTLPSCKKKADEQTAVKPAYNFEKKADKVTVTNDGVTFTDFFGTEKTLKRGAYKRVVSLYHSHTALWYDVGGKLVGRVHTQGAEKQLPAAALSEDVKIVANGITINTISVEEVLRAEPDLVILGQAMGQPGLVPALTSAGLETIVVDYNDLSDYLKWYKIFSYLNGTEANYETVAKKTLENVLAILGKVPTTENPPTVLPIFSAFGKITASLSGTALGRMINQLHAVNVADKLPKEKSDGRMEMNLESIVLADPDIIVIQAMNEEMTKVSMEKEYSNNELWNSLRAVKDGKVYILPSNLFHYRPHSNYDKSYQYMFDILYPVK